MTMAFLDEEDVLTLLSTNFSRLMYQLALLLAALNYYVLTFIELIRWSEPVIHCDKQMIHPIACQAFFVFDIVLASFLDRTAEKWTGNGWKKRECHAGKVHRVEWNLGSLQRGHSLCTWRACSTNLTTRASHQLFFLKELKLFVFCSLCLNRSTWSHRRKHLIDGSHILSSPMQNIKQYYVVTGSTVA